MNYVVKIRREFHMYPELSGVEFETSKRIKRELEQMGIPYKNIGETGVMGIITGGSKGETIALRADIDALPVLEENSYDFKSKNEGIMHACGHDAHIAILLDVARRLNEQKEKLSGTVKLFFQSEEETGGGAPKIIESGELEGVKYIAGLHIWSDMETGEISVDPGPRMGAVGQFSIHMQGFGGHGAMPHQCVDPIPAGAAVVQSLQTIVSREVEPGESAVVTIGSFNSGTRWNIIANDATLTGTVRTFSPRLVKSIPESIERIVKGICESYKVKYKFEYVNNTLVLVNNDKVSQFAKEVLENELPKIKNVNYEKTPVGEDMSFLQDKVPGVFAFVGCRNKEKGIIYPHHHPKFDVDEDSLELASDFMVALGKKLLNN